jgi:hypothetical protein
LPLLPLPQDKEEQEETDEEGHGGRLRYDGHGKGSGEDVEGSGVVGIGEDDIGEGAAGGAGDVEEVEGVVDRGEESVAKVDEEVSAVGDVPGQFDPVVFLGQLIRSPELEAGGGRDGEGGGGEVHVDHRVEVGGADAAGSHVESPGTGKGANDIGATP